MSPKDAWRNPELNDKVGPIYTIYNANVNGRALRINSWFLPQNMSIKCNNAEGVVDLQLKGTLHIGITGFGNFVLLICTLIYDYKIVMNSA